MLFVHIRVSADRIAISPPKSGGQGHSGYSCYPLIKTQFLQQKKVFSPKCSPSKKFFPQIVLPSKSVLPKEVLPRKSVLSKVFSSTKVFSLWYSSLFSPKNVFSSKCSALKKCSTQKRSSLKSVLLKVLSPKKVFSSKCSSLKECSPQSVLLRYHHEENTSSHCSQGSLKIFANLRVFARHLGRQAAAFGRSWHKYL